MLPLLLFFLSRAQVNGDSAKACKGCFRDIRKVTHKESINIAGFLPKSREALDGFISRKMGAYGLGDVPDLDSLEDKRALAFFLSLGNRGNAAQKKYFAAVENLSRDPSGKVVLFDPMSPHQFWKLPSELDSDDDFLTYAIMLNQVAKEANKVGKDGERVTKKGAFLIYLEQKAGNDPEKIKSLEQVRDNHCFFRRAA